MMIVWGSSSSSSSRISSSACCKKGIMYEYKNNYFYSKQHIHAALGPYVLID